MSRAQRTGQQACDLVAQFEEKSGRTVEKARPGSGYDLMSTKGRDVRKIEVKAETGSQLMGKHAYPLTVQEWKTFSRDKDAWLYIVYSLHNNPKLVRLQKQDLRLHQINVIAPRINIRFRKEDRERLEPNAEDLC